MTADDTKPGTGLSNQWAAREERADHQRIMDLPRKFGQKGKDKSVREVEQVEEAK